MHYPDVRYPVKQDNPGSWVGMNDHAWQNGNMQSLAQNDAWPQSQSQSEDTWETQWAEARLQDGTVLVARGGAKSAPANGAGTEADCQPIGPPPPRPDAGAPAAETQAW